jgi:hypothetical protein
LARCVASQSSICPAGILWLLDRLRKKWPTISEGSLRGKINYWSASNEFLFIRNDIAVGLAVAMRDNLDGRPYMRAIFTFARDDAEQSSLGEKAIVGTGI